MRLRIKGLPLGRQLEGFDLKRFEVGRVYDVGPRLAELLVVMDYAEPEMRWSERSRAADKSKGKK